MRKITIVGRDILSDRDVVLATYRGFSAKDAIAAAGLDEMNRGQYIQLRAFVAIDPETDEPFERD